MRGRGNLLKDEKVAALRKAYGRGATIKEAAAEAKVSHVTVMKYFQSFGREGAERGARVARPRKPRRSRFDQPAPRYDGPALIGKPISAGANQMAGAPGGNEVPFPRGNGGGSEKLPKR